MKFFSFKILLLCILLPPLMYLGTVRGLERYLTRHYHDEIKNIYLSGMNNILNGSIALRQSIQQSIESYLAQKSLLEFGLQLTIKISTTDGIVLYPPIYQAENPADQLNQNSMDIARQNFRLLNNGLRLSIDVNIRPYSALATFILSFYIMISGLGLYAYFRKASRKLQQADTERLSELSRLRRLEDDFSQQINVLSSERESLLLEYQALEKAIEEQKRNAKQNEEEMFDEIEQLELRLKDNLSRQENQSRELLTLEEKINELEKLKDTLDKQKEKNIDKFSKRFRTLYKNIDTHDRALIGLSELTDEMALKAEEVIHQLNDDPSAVPIKRKVFSKKGKTTAFEIVFAYNGRIYFRKNGQQRLEILAVGTKNTQPKDLAYLDRLG